MTKYNYKIIGLDCLDCARKVEERLNKEEKLHNVVINFATSKISYETETDNCFQMINKIIDEVEPGSKMVLEEKEKKEYHYLVLVIALILGIIGSREFKFHEIFLYLSYILLLYTPFKKAWKMLIKSHTINENLLICISTIGALLIGSEMEGVMVASLYMLGKILEEQALNKTRMSIQNLLLIKQDYANLKVGKDFSKISVEDVKIGDILCIKKGEKVPVDGEIIKGKTTFDTSALTGESELVELTENDKIFSGYVNTSNMVLMKSSSLYKDSTISKIIELAMTAGEKKAKVETTVTKFSKIYTPIILLLSLVVGILLPIITNVSYHDSLYRALTFLVIACPCAIAISVPLSYFTGIGVASKNGILIKGSNYLDNLSHLKKIIFDKTGTLTTGNFEVTKIEVLDNEYTKREVIDILRKGEAFSNHPIARSIMRLDNSKVDTKDVSDYKEIDGVGISFKLKDKIVKIGTKKVCDDKCSYNVSLHLNINSHHVASIYIDDGIKKNALKVLDDIKTLGIKSYIFTGDKKEVAKEVAKNLNIKDYYAEMLPTDKYKKYEEIEKGEITAYVGDGINDSPVLKRASIGISMGSLGSDIAISASDIVIMNDDLRKIPLGIKISKYTSLVIKENLIFALSVKIIILILSIFGLSSMWFAVFADTGVTLLTVLNSLKIIKKFKKL